MNQLESPIVPPRTPVEEAPASIRAEVLRLDDVGVHDNFLELGGDSLLAGQPVAEMALVIAQNQAEQAGQEDLDRMLAELEALSEEQAKQLPDQGNERNDYRCVDPQE